MSTPRTLSANLTGQVAIVTGASQGLGQAMALELAINGAKVACIARNADKHKAVIHGLNVAAWDSFTTLKMVDENDKETGGSTRGVEDSNGTVPAMPLDAALPERCNPHLVKIDVEGAEARVLRGLAGTIARCKPTFLIEMHDMYFGPEVRTETIQFLESIGYEWNDDLKYGPGYYIVAHPPSDFEIEVVRAGQ